MNRGGREGAFLPLPPQAERKRKMVKVRFSASGFGSTTYEHADEESAWAAMRADAREVADEHGGEVNEAGDEIVVARPGGDEIARWELLK